MSETLTEMAAASPSPTRAPRTAQRPRWATIISYVCLSVGALGFAFPFYYMVLASLQTTRDPTAHGIFPWPSNLSFNNYSGIDEAIDLGRSLVNSFIFTGGVVACTLLFGVVAGYALAVLRYRGRGTLFAMVLLVQTVPFQLLMVPLYVMTVRAFGLADNYLGMILPFAINSTAVLIFRSYFLQLPRDLFNAARIDGAGEMRVFWSIALPLVRPAVLTATLLTFIGPWNEFLWPFLITKDQSKQPLAVSLANYIDKAGQMDNPFGVLLAGAVILSIPAIVLFLIFQRHFVSTELGSGVKG